MTTKPETWVIGDIHGCFSTLEVLVKRLGHEANFDLDHDHLWLLGDLVNRGPHSLQVLRWVHATHKVMGERFVCVLGNHDLHLLAAAQGLRKAKSELKPILQANDAQPLLDWLRHRPLLHRQGSWLMVHAGLWPHWHDKKAEKAARRVEKKLRGRHWHRLLEPANTGDINTVDANPGDDDSPSSSLFAFTSLRLLQPGGRPSRFKGPPAEAPSGDQPWFHARPRDRAAIVFGHWAALGTHLAESACCLDSGAAWGGPLTAMRLGDRSILQQQNLDH